MLFGAIWEVPLCYKYDLSSYHSDVFVYLNNHFDSKPSVSIDFILMSVCRFSFTFSCKWMNCPFLCIAVYCFLLTLYFVWPNIDLGFIKFTLKSKLTIQFWQSSTMNFIHQSGPKNSCTRRLNRQKMVDIHNTHHFTAFH